MFFKMGIFRLIVLLFTIEFVCLYAQDSGCPSNWTNTDGFCYKVFKGEGDNKDFDSAQGACASFGGYLAEIPNYFVQKTIAAGVDDHCWIGLRKNGTGKYYWRSGRELNEFQFWEEEEPGSEECVSLYHDENSEWETKDCSEAYNCYICMAGSIDPPPYPTPQIGCYDGDVIDGRCYQAMDEEVSWQIAQWECELLGGDLAEISNETVYTEIINYLPDNDKYYWIGLRLNTTTDQYEWRSGRVLNDSFVNWKEGNGPSSNNGDGLDCVVASKDEIWELKNCNNKEDSYICQREIISTTVPPLGLMTKNKTSISTTMQVSSTISTISTSSTSTPATVEKDENTLEQIECRPSQDGNQSNITACPILTQVLEEIFELQKVALSNKYNNGYNLNSLLTLDLIVGGIIKIQNNGLILVVAKIEENTDTNVTISDRVSIGILSDSFPGGGAITISALVSVNDSPLLTRSETGQSLKVASDICSIVSDKVVIGMVAIEFKSDEEDGEVLCYFFNTTTDSWSTEGIITKQLAEGRIRCLTDHFTSFALLVTFQPSDGLDEETLTIQAYISIALCSASLLFLLGSLVLYACVGKKFFSRDLNIIHLNYVIALTLALLAFIAYSGLFFAEVKLDADNGFCKVIAFFNHYFWLTVFSWNFCEAFHIVLALYSHRIPNKRHYFWLLAIGWGFPIPIAVITLGTAFNYYTNAKQEVCFLNIERGVIWGFLGPAYFIILVNTCILIFVITMTIYVQRKRSFKKYLCSLIIGTATTLPLLGLPWIAGILPNLAGLLRNDSIAWLSYVFIIINASQGVIFFLIHVIRNDQVIGKLCNRSALEFTDELGNKKSPKHLKIEDEPNSSSKRTTDPNEYISTETERIGDILCTIPIENPTYESSSDTKYKK